MARKALNLEDYIEETLRASSTASATSQSSDILNPGFRSAVFFIDVTSVPGSASANVSLTLQFKDPVSGNYVGVFTGGTTSTTSAVMIGEIAGSVSSGGSPVILPRTFRAQYNVSAGATSKDVVFSVGVCWIK